MHARVLTIIKYGKQDPILEIRKLRNEMTHSHICGSLYSPQLLPSSTPIPWTMLSCKQQADGTVRPTKPTAPGPSRRLCDVPTLLCFRVMASCIRQQSGNHL